jgi:hypothetical protein
MVRAPPPSIISKSPRTPTTLTITLSSKSPREEAQHCSQANFIPHDGYVIVDYDLDSEF